MSVTMTLRELAEKFSVSFRGDPNCLIAHVADIESASEGSITFLSDKRYKQKLFSTGAAAVILSKEYLEDCPKPALITDNPHALYARIASLLNPDEDMAVSPGVHPSAVISTASQIDPTAIVCANAVIEEDVSIGPQTYIGPCCVLKRRSKIGSNCKLVANVTLCSDSVIGDRVLIHPAAVIGSDGFGFARESEQWVKIPQLGHVTVGDDVEIGAGVAIDRGAINETVIERGVKLDNQIHIAHNVKIGANTAMAAQSGVAGSTNIGEACTIGGAVGMLGHLDIAARTHLNAFSQVSHSIERSGSYASGAPLELSASWRRNRVRMKQLDEMAKRIRNLEKALGDEKKS